MGRIDIDLNDRRLVRVELGPGEIRSEQKQHVTVENGVIAGASADDAGHADIVGIVVLDEVLAARRVGHWRLQPCRRGDHLVVRACAAGAGIDGDRVALVENGCDLIEVRVTRANERTPRMNGIRGFLVRGGIGDVRRDDEHGDTAFRQGGLAGRDGLAAGLLRRQDHLAIDAAALEHVVEIDLLDRFEAQVLPHDLGCDQNDRGAVAIGFIEAIDEVETAGAAGSCAGRETAGEQTLRRGRREAPASSCRMWTQSISLRSMAWAMRFNVSPTIP